MSRDDGETVAPTPTSDRRRNQVVVMVVVEEEEEEEVVERRSGCRIRGQKGWTERGGGKKETRRNRSTGWRSARSEAARHRGVDARDKVRGSAPRVHRRRRWCEHSEADRESK